MSTMRSTGKGRAQRSSSHNDQDAACQTLWQAVIMQALYDAALGSKDEKREALDWFTTAALHDACDSAGMVPSKVLSFLHQLLTEHDRAQRIWLMNRIRDRMHMIR